jgi:competence protein ComEC
VVWVWQQWPDTRLKIVFCDVGQGDGAIVILGAFQAVVDTGAYEDKTMRCLSDNLPFWDRKIEIVFLSHSDKDHAGALSGIVKRYQVDRIIDNPHSGDVVRYGSLSFDIIKGSLLVDEVATSDESQANLKSVVMRLVFGEFAVLFTGDIDLEAELALVGGGVLKKSSVLKASHHGSKYGSGVEFLEAVSPKLVIISVGAKNNYGHPHGDTLRRLDAVGAKVFRTDQMGTVSLVSDGKKIEIYTEK